MTSAALHDAITAGDLATTKEILCKNGSLISEVLNENEDNALTLSLSLNQTEIASYLLSCKDVKVNHRNKEGKAGLFYCMSQLKEKKGSEEMLKLLQQMVISIGGCDINERLTSRHDKGNEMKKENEDDEFDYPIHFAIKHGQVEALRILFESERPLLDVNVQSMQRRQSVLHIIVHKRALALLHQFMFMVSTSNGQKLDLDALDCDRHTPLYKSILLCQYAMATVLCQFGANVNAFCGTFKQTVAHLIFQSWPDSETRFYGLLDTYKAKMLVMDANGKLPIELATMSVSGGRKEVQDDAKTDEKPSCGFELFMQLPENAFDKSECDIIEETEDGIDLQSLRNMTTDAKRRLSALCPFNGRTPIDTELSQSCPYQTIHQDLLKTPLPNTQSINVHGYGDHAFVHPHSKLISISNSQKQCPFAKLAKNTPEMGKEAKCPFQSLAQKSNDHTLPSQPATQPVDEQLQMNTGCFLM